MAGIRPKDLATTATSPAADDYLAIDGTASGTRKMLAQDLLPHVETVAALRAKGADFAPKMVWLVEYTATLKNGAGLLILDEADTTTADDGGMTFVTAGGKRYKRPQRGHVSVKDFGARGNTTGDDTPAIQAAIEYVAARQGQAGNPAAPGRSGVVFMPQGQYLLNTSLFLRQGVTLRGEGVFASTITAAAGFTGVEGWPKSMVIYHDPNSVDPNLFNSLLEYLDLNTAAHANMIALYGERLNEWSGARGVNVQNLGPGAKGAYFKRFSSSTPNTNMVLEQVGFHLGAQSDANTVGLHLEGTGTSTVSPRLIDSCSFFNNITKPRAERGVGLRLENVRRAKVVACQFEALRRDIEIINSRAISIDTNNFTNVSGIYISGESAGEIVNASPGINPNDNPQDILIVNDVTGETIPASPYIQHFPRYEFDTRPLNWGAVEHAATSSGSATLVATAQRGKEYTVWIEVTTALDGAATFRLGDGTTDDRYLAATGASTTGYHHVPVKIMGDGAPIVLTWASTSAGELVSRVREA